MSFSAGVSPENPHDFGEKVGDRKRGVAGKKRDVNREKDWGEWGGETGDVSGERKSMKVRVQVQQKANP